jgi:hypothetical protein
MKIKNVLLSLIPVVVASVFFQIVYSIEGHPGFILFEYFKQDVLVGIGIIVMGVCITILIYCAMMGINDNYDTLRQFNEQLNGKK